MVTTNQSTLKAARGWQGSLASSLHVGSGRVGLSESPNFTRVELMKESGQIERYDALLNRSQLWLQAIRPDSGRTWTVQNQKHQVACPLLRDDRCHCETCS
ncbi:MAG: hypothetical protein ACI8Z1_000632 [Candidatus Azotimanducaceae bacterium]|jgi:hypothetical protein